MDCWALLGLVNLVLSLRLAAARVLIKVLRLLPVQKQVMKVFADKLALPGAEDFGFEEYPNKPLKGQAIVGEEACNGKGGSTDHAQPTRRLLTNDRMQQQVDASRHCDGHSTAKELPGR